MRRKGFVFAVDCASSCLAIWIQSLCSLTVPPKTKIKQDWLRPVSWIVHGQLREKIFMMKQNPIVQSIHSILDQFTNI